MIVASPRLYLWLTVVGCTLAVDAIVWSVSHSHFVVSYTSTISIFAAWLYLKTPQHLGSILVKSITAGAVGLAVWWATNHLHG